MPYQSPTLSELIKQGQQDIQFHLPNVQMNAVLMVLNRINAALSASEHQHLSWLAQQIIPTTADEEYLIEYAAMKGIVRKAASTATGEIIVTATGATHIAQDTPFEAYNGVVLLTTESVEIDEAGDYVLTVEAKEDGAIGNLAENTQVQLTSAILNLKAQAKVQAMSGGADMESLSSLLSRLIFRVQYPPAGGSKHDYVRWATEVVGVTRAWCFPRYRGLGTVGVAFVMDEQADILPKAQDLARVRAYIEGHYNETTRQFEGMPANVELYVFAPKLQPINFRIRLEPNTDGLKKTVKQALSQLLQQVESEGIIYLSHIRAAISNVIGERDNAVFEPSADVQLPINTIAVLGEIEWL
ncbi:TPA: baseplate J/gp47 family protein [Pasteurella multocida]|nr:baseplate J/gp47 family protein [Pasteurella multocida]